MIDPEIVEFEDHSLTRMKERNISRKMVMDVIAYPDRYIPQKQGMKMLVEKQIKNRKIRVWYFSYPKKIIVKTVA